MIDEWIRKIEVTSESDEVVRLDVLSFRLDIEGLEGLFRRLMAEERNE